MMETSILLKQVGKRLVEANVIKSCPHFVQNTSSAGIKDCTAHLQTGELPLFPSKGLLC